MVWVTLLLALSARAADVDQVDAKWRAMQTLAVRPDLYRVVDQPIVVREGALTLTVREGVMIPIFSGYPPNDKKAQRQARIEAFEHDSKAPPPLIEGDMAFVGFVFAGAKAEFAVDWQERADSLVFANRQVTHLGKDREDWVDVAHGAPWTGVVNEGMVISTDPAVQAAFLGPDHPESDPLEVLVYQERDYTAARIRARILFGERRAAMMRAGVHAGRLVTWNRVAAHFGLSTRGRNAVVDVHIDQNLGSADDPPGQQPADIDWMTLIQDWSGAQDQRRSSVLASLDTTHDAQLIHDTITGVPFQRVDPADATSAMAPPSRVETDEAYIVVQAVPMATQLRVELSARLRLRAIGGDFQVIPIDIPRAGSQHDWRLRGITDAEGTSLISSAPLLEHNPDGVQPAEALANVDLGGPTGGPFGPHADAFAVVGTSSGGNERMTDFNRGREVTRVRLTLPEPVRDGREVVVDVRWKDVWPYGDARTVGTGAFLDTPSVVHQNGAASGPQLVLPRPVGAGREQATRFRIQVVVPQRTELVASVAGELEREWEDEHGYRHTLSGHTSGPVPYPLVHIGAFTVHDEAAAAGMPTIRARVLSAWDGPVLAGETRAQIAFFQDFLPDYPWSEHEIAVGPAAGIGQAWASGQSHSGVSLTGVTTVTEGGNFTRQTGSHTTQHRMAHELAHQWFGQSVRPADASDAWFSEAFAEVFGALYTSALHDQDARIYSQKRRRFETALNGPIRRTSLVEAHGSLNESELLFDYGPYLLQQMLRPRLGNARYHAAIDLLARDFAGSPATTEQVQSWFEQAAGRDLGDFFDFWVYGGFVPKKVQLDWDHRGDTLFVELSSDVPFGTFDVPVVVDGVEHWVNVVDGIGTASLPMGSRPAAVALDPEHRILAVHRSERQRAGVGLL